jgi:hypothetical protein
VAAARTAFREGTGCHAYSGAAWDLRSNALRPGGWPSADAAGLPILPGLARREEADAGVIRHALRVSIPVTQKAYIDPATHWASSTTGPDQPPMGLRLRLQASYDIRGLRGHTRVIAPLVIERDRDLDELVGRHYRRGNRSAGGRQRPR